MGRINGHLRSCRLSHTLRQARTTKNSHPYMLQPNQTTSTTRTRRAWSSGTILALGNPNKQVAPVQAWELASIFFHRCFVFFFLILPDLSFAMYVSLSLSRRNSYAPSSLYRQRLVFIDLIRFGSDDSVQYTIRYTIRHNIIVTL